MEPKFLSTKEAAARLGISERTMRRICTDNLCAHRKITPRKIEIREDWLEAYVEEVTKIPDYVKETLEND